MSEQKQPPNLGVPDKLPPVSILHPSNPNNSLHSPPQSQQQFQQPPPMVPAGVPPPAYFVPNNVQPSFAPHPASLTGQLEFQPQLQQQPQPQMHPSAPFAVPAPPPGSLDRAPGYNLELEDEWCMIEKSPPAVLPPNHMPASITVHNNGTAQSMSSMTPHVAAPAIQPVGTTQGSENLGYIYPTINQAALTNTRSSQMLPPPNPFVVNPAPGAQVLQPSTAASQPFYPFGQQPTEALVTYSPFNITADVANGIFVKWKEQLWFTPADFGSKMCEAQLKPILMPYYIFDAGVFTSYDGQVGYVETTISHHHHHHHGVNHGNHSSTSTSTSIRWRRASGTKSGMYPGVLTIGSVVKEDYPKLAQIDGWHIDTLITTPMSTDQLGPAVDWSSAFYSTPNGAYSMIIKSEEQACAGHLKRDNHADRTQHVHVNVGITSLSYRVVYLPIYFTVYSYQGKVFKVFINGQSGKIYGERPYGMGGFVNGLKTIGSLFKKKQKAEILSGVELQQRDNTTVYNASSKFVVLPPSDRQLGVVSVGYVTIENPGPTPVQLVSQKRLTSIQGGAVLLQPHSSKSFDFIGEWVIELVGECSHVRIVDFAAKGGAKGNELNMKA
eukprot:TRINITY_DN76_c0_g1_i1.p1 TRINITY_DN76_c0_g1~~TRINITY_DN76_c0_g1_i1.p1  ORF type:complete len:609 (-),score=150.78 TRINITY_DN76_c0_g1_i1:136-1962(-)